MNIIIPVTDNMEAKDILAPGFHNTEYVCIYESDNDSYKWFKKKDISKKEGNLSIELKRKGIYTIITSQIELMTLVLFNEMGLKVYKAKSTSIIENIKFFHNHQLELFTPKSAIGVLDCVSSCGSGHTSFN